MNGKVIIVLFTLLLLHGASCSNSGGRSLPVKSPITEKKSDTLITPNYNVYIENSASIDGYVNGITDFENSVYAYLVDLDNSEIADSLSFFYVNSKPIFFGRSAKEFIKDLEPWSFKKRGGDRSTTDLHALIRELLNNTDSANVNVLISDFIFSLGKQNAQDGLSLFGTSIEDVFAKALKDKPELALVVFHLESDFDGYYYDKNDTPQKYNGSRPFYIWVMGYKQHLAHLIEASPVSGLKGSGLISSAMYYAGNNTINYTVKPDPRIYELDVRGGNPKTDIIKVKKDPITDKVKFMVNVDFGSLLLAEEYLLNIENYSVSDDVYKVTSVVKMKKNTNFTHTLTLESPIIKPTKLKIMLNSNAPAWIDAVNDDEGLMLDASNSNRTFGLKHLLNGVYEGFSLTNHKYATMNININQN